MTSALTVPLIAHIRSHLIDADIVEDAECGIATPADYSGTKFVRLGQLGGRATLFSNYPGVHLHTMDVSVHVYEETDLAADEFVGEVLDELLKLSSSETVSVNRCRLVSGPTWLPDESRPSNPYPRFVSTVAVTYHPI